MIDQNILIIDDHQGFRETLRELIQRNFPQVHIEEAQSGEEGVIRAVNQKPDVSLIDICLPGIRSFDPDTQLSIETAKQIKTLLPHMHIITMSMFQERSFEELFAKKNMTFINKANMDGELVALLKKMLNGNKKDMSDTVVT